MVRPEIRRGGQTPDLTVSGNGGIRRYGAPGEIRTPDLTLRRRSLYPAELRARITSIPHFALHRRNRLAAELSVPYSLFPVFARNSSITDWISSLAPSMPPSTACRSSAGLFGFR